MCREFDVPSVPSDSVDSFCARASIWEATAALRSRSSFRCCSSAFFSSIRASRAGDWALELLAVRRCEWEGMERVGNDISKE